MRKFAAVLMCLLLALPAMAAEEPKVVAGVGSAEDFYSRPLIEKEEPDWFVPVGAAAGLLVGAGFLIRGGRLARKGD